MYQENKKTLKNYTIDEINYGYISELLMEF